MRERAFFAFALHSSIPHRISFYSTRFSTVLLPILSLSLSLSPISFLVFAVSPSSLLAAMFIRLSVACCLFTLFRFIFLPLCGCQFYLPFYCTNLTFICPALLAVLPPPLLYLHLCFVFGCHMISQL